MRQGGLKDCTPIVRGKHLELQLNFSTGTVQHKKGYLKGTMPSIFSNPTFLFLRCYKSGDERDTLRVRATERASERVIKRGAFEHYLR